MKEKEHESDRNRIKPDADGSCGVHRRAASDPCRCRFGKDEGTDAPHRLPDPGKGVNPWNIMAITFTNKAAGEMRERVDKIVGYGSERIWVSTFHSSCVRILRRHAERLGYANNFAIYDTDDQKSLIKDIMKRLQMDPKLYRDRAIMAAISSARMR